jgi:hypothetical protein
MKLDIKKFVSLLDTSETNRSFIAECLSPYEGQPLTKDDRLEIVTSVCYELNVNDYVVFDIFVKSLTR